MRRIDYAGSVHDEEEIAAVVEVLRGPSTALRIGKNVRAFEQGVAELFGKRRGVMCNSGSSALYLAVELLGCSPGDEVITSAVTFSTDIAPMVRAGIVPAFVDVELPGFLERRQRNFRLLSEYFATHPDVFVLPRTLDGLDTGWHMFPILIRPERVRRAEFQQHMESHGVDTRMVWTGNVMRQPAFAKVARREAPGGYPNADRVMEQGLVLPSNHGLDDDDIAYICETVEAFV